MTSIQKKILSIELVYDVSFLKILKLIVDGDVESNPGPTNTPTGTPKGRKAKRTTFNFSTRRKLDMDCVKNDKITAASSKVSDDHPITIDENSSIDANQNISNKITVVQSDICNVNAKLLLLLQNTVY